MIDHEIKQLRILCDAATTGPWVATEGGTVKSMSMTREVNKRACMVQVALAVEPQLDEDTTTPRPNNAKFIAASREALPRLIDEVDRLQRLCRECLMYAEAFLEDSLCPDEDDVARLRDIAKELAPR